MSTGRGHIFEESPRESPSRSPRQRRHAGGVRLGRRAGRRLARQPGCRRPRRAAAAWLQLRRVACRHLYPAGRPWRGAGRAHARAVARATHGDPRALPRERVRPLARPAGASRLRPSRKTRGRWTARPRCGASRSEAARAAARTSSSCCSFLPNASKTPVPVLLLINNRPATNTDPTRKEKSGFWPAEQVIARGYGIAAIQYGRARARQQGSLSRRRHDAVRWRGAAYRADTGARLLRGRGARAARWTIS